MIPHAGHSIEVSLEIWRTADGHNNQGKDFIERFKRDTAHLLQHYHSSALCFSVVLSFALCSSHSRTGALGGGLEVSQFVFEPLEYWPVRYGPSLRSEIFSFVLSLRSVIWFDV